MARRLAPALLLVAALSAACGGEPVASPSTSPRSDATATSPATSPASSATPSATPTTTVDDDVEVPDGAPTSLAEDVPATQLANDPPMPRGASLASSWAGDGETQAIAFAWRRGEDPLAAENGFEVWIRFPGEETPWRAVYAFTDRPSSGVFGISFDEGDVTGDGAADVLTFEDLGGSGACGTWRVVRIADADATETWARQTCDTRVRIVGGDLEIREAVYEPGDAHCCPSAYRTTRLRWDGTGWAVLDRTTEPA